jgi:hypothetical protein
LRTRPPLATGTEQGAHDRIDNSKKPKRHCAWPVLSHTEKENAMLSENLSRRAILAGAAAGPALAFPAGVIPPEPDPILAAIEEHRRAWGPEFDSMTREGNEEAPQELDRLLESVDAALVNISPTTIGGVAAILAYAAEFVTTYDGAGWPDGEAWIDRHKLPSEVILHKNLAKTLQAMVVQS